MSGIMERAAETAGSKTESCAGMEDADFALEVPHFNRTAVMGDVRRLSTVSNWRAAGAIAFQWTVIVVAWWAAVASGHWAVYVLAALVIASRQQALGVMVHDATHYLLFTNHRVNDIVSDLFLGFPIGISTTLYRAHHLNHHRYTNTPRDPDWVSQQEDRDWQWPKTRWGCVSLLMRSLLGLNMAQAAKVYVSLSPNAKLFTPITPAYPLRARVLCVVGGIVAWTVVIVTRSWWPVFFLWVLPSATLLNVFGRVRFTAEHIGVENEHELNFSRTVIPNWLERVFIAPCGINYHVEHHMFPSVPGWRLKELHDVLMRDESYNQRAHITHSYFGRLQGVFAELMNKVPQKS